MIRLLTTVDLLALGAMCVVGASFLISCIWEREQRATVFAAFQLALMVVVLTVFAVLAGNGFFHSIGGGVILLVGTTAAAAGAMLLLRKDSSTQRALQGAAGTVVGAVERVDERTVVFARNRLVPGSEPYRMFYESHPEYLQVDDERRQKGSVLGTFGSIDAPREKPNVSAMVALRYFSASLADPETVTPAQAPFFKGHKEEMSPATATERIKGYARHLGADLVGIAKLDHRWVYSHRGTVHQKKWDQGGSDWSQWGTAIALNHSYAIVFAEEMDRAMIAASPHTPIFVESMHNYAKGAFIATQLAAYLANLGYSATANHVQHYQLILPPLAADAGLGEVGRIGYLMTKEFGPRVRLSAVTTDLPLIPDQPKDIGAHHFCTICKKCATCCPSGSIPADDAPKEVNGSLRWKLNAETCFAYWGKVGTDCGICMKVCPWSHARTWPHKLIVWMITRNKYARILFNWMDDLFYGRKPKPGKPPQWAAYR
jgi:reductive dehalogenase